MQQFKRGIYLSRRHLILIIAIAKTHKDAEHSRQYTPMSSVLYVYRDVMGTTENVILPNEYLNHIRLNRTCIHN